MKKAGILLSITLAIISLTSWSSELTTSGSETTDNDYAYLRFIPDSVKSLIKDKNFIILYFGHNSNNWSLIYEDGATYKILGKQSWEKKYTESFDTVALLAANAKYIKWGLDSLPLIGPKMKGIEKNDFIAGYYESIDFFNAETKLHFCTNNYHKWSGPDSVRFNKYISRIYGFMLWIAAQEIRHIFREDAVFSEPKDSI